MSLSRQKILHRIPERIDFAIRSLYSWLDQNTFKSIFALILVGIVLRFFLVYCTKSQFGFFWDEYFGPVIWAYDHGRLPTADDSWMAYHPQLYTIFGLLFYSVGRIFRHGALFLTLLSMVCCIISSIYCYRILRFYRIRKAYLVVGTAFILCFPCLFYSSYTVDGDVMLSTIMIMFVFYLIRYFSKKEHPRFKDVLLLGLLCGMAIATKYSGLMALMIMAQVLGVRLLFGPCRKRIVRDGLIILTMSLAIGSWKYIDNYSRYHEIFHGNTGWGASQDYVNKRTYYWNYFDFTSFRLGDAIKLFSKDAPRNRLNLIPVYMNVWTSLHSQAWTDMSFWTVPQRSGGKPHPLPDRFIPVWIPASVLILALLPYLLAFIGFFATLRHRTMFPLLVTASTTMLVYLHWMVTVASWSVKTKYILYLFPIFLLYILIGHRWMDRYLPRPVWAVTCIFLFMLVFMAHLYDFRFAIGH